MAEKPWGGRFESSTDELVEAFTTSIDIDWRLYAEDIKGSRAHACMLGKQGIISTQAMEAILKGLDAIEAEIESGHFAFLPELEDVHMNIEDRLIKLIGEDGKRLHTARSRNDQVATDLRLFLRRRLADLVLRIRMLQYALVEIADRHAKTIMPGFTHLQIAQPVTFGHHMLAYVEMLERDIGRFLDARKRMNECPLGSAALAGTGFPIDREMTATTLGFDRPCANSLDAVSDRDFVVEILAAAAICARHLSRFSEELILWSSQQFGFIDLPDAFCTGSSIMPQKKNPDVPELVRGKAGGILGGLVAMLTTIKGLPLAYNRDLQEDKAALFAPIDNLEDCLKVYAELIPRIKLNTAIMRQAAASGHLLFGENYLQEAEAKIAALPKDFIWHFIGYLHIEELLNKASVSYSGAYVPTDREEYVSGSFAPDQVFKSAPFQFEKIKKITLREQYKDCLRS